MDQTNTHTKNNEKFIKMTTEPVEKLIGKLAIPTIISMLVTSFYNLADTFFVRQLENDSMVAAVGVVLPLMTVIQAFGFFCGHGSGNYISRAYGKQDYKDAETMAATGFCYAVLFGLIIEIFGLLFIDPLTVLLGAKTEATINATKEYMRYILYATPFMTGAIVMNNQLRMQGNAFFAMIGLTSGAVVNLVLDPLLIYSAGDGLFGGLIKMPIGAGMGVGGAALATAISQILGFIILSVGVMRSDNIKIHPKNFSPRIYYIKNIIRGGLPSLARQGIASVSSACLNHAVGIFVEEDVMIDAVQAAMTGVSKIMMFLSSALTGFGQGFQPVCGFNYGAGKYKRVIRAYMFCVKVASIALVLIACVGFIFAEPITAAIAGSSALAGEIAAVTFKAQLVVFPLMSWVTMCNMMLQNIGMTAKATIVAMSRQGIAFIPAVFLIPLLTNAVCSNPVSGLQLAQSAADLLSFLISLPIGISVLKEMAAKGT